LAKREGELRRPVPQVWVTTNHVLGLKLVLPDGSIVDVGGTNSGNASYDLTGVFVGSEGTLGIATEVPCEFSKADQFVFS